MSGKKISFHRSIFALCLFPFAFEPSATVQAAPDAQRLYDSHCIECHERDRLGGFGPALLPENLERLRRVDAVKTITEGRAATRMPAFGQELSKDQIEALANLIYTPPARPPVWGEAEINDSRIEYYAPGSLPDTPVFKADLLNLFVVVEKGDHSASILDGDRFEVIKRFPTRYALHGGPKFSHDGRFVYFASRDGWIAKYDIYNLATVAEIRAGINTRNLAVSGDGRFVLVGNYLPHTLVLLDARDLSLLKVIPVVAANGKSSRISAVYQAAPRSSFIAALKDVPEVWEIPYNGAPENGFPVRRIAVNDYLDDFFFDQPYRHLMGTARDSKKGQVIDLDSGKKIAELEVPGMPHLGSGITWEYQGRPVMASPNLKEGLVSVIDMQDWKTVKQIKTAGAGFFMRSHENTPYAWVDAFNSGAAKDTLQLIDKRTLEVAKTVRPMPGKTAAHVEFTRDGKYALVSIWEMDGALIVYDAETLQEIKRLPMKIPVGKYNVYNKTTRSAGTSH